MRCAFFVKPFLVCSVTVFLLLHKSHTALITRVWFLSCVDPHMIFAVFCMIQMLSALGTRVCLASSVDLMCFRSLTSRALRSYSGLSCFINRRKNIINKVINSSLIILSDLLLWNLVLQCHCFKTLSHIKHFRMSQTVP